MKTLDQYIKSTKDKSRTVLAFSFFPTKMSDTECIWFRFFYKLQIPCDHYYWENRAGQSGFKHHWKTIHKSIKVKDRSTHPSIYNAIEFGYKQCEEGNNIQMAIKNYNKIKDGIY